MAENAPAGSSAPVITRSEPFVPTYGYDVTPPNAFSSAVSSQPSAALSQFVSPVASAPLSKAVSLQSPISAASQPISGSVNVSPQPARVSSASSKPTSKASKNVSTPSSRPSSPTRSPNVVSGSPQSIPSGQPSPVTASYSYPAPSGAPLSIPQQGPVIPTRQAQAGEKEPFINQEGYRPSLIGISRVTEPQQEEFNATYNPAISTLQVRTPTKQEAETLEHSFDALIPGGSVPATEPLAEISRSDERERG